MRDVWLDAELRHRGLTSQDVMAKILRRVGVDESFFKKADPITVPAEAQSYLLQGNPRLRELQALYRTFTEINDHHSLWNASLIDRDVPLTTFRGDCAFVWQKRNLNTPAAFVLTAYYMFALGMGPLLAEMGEDNLFGCYTVDAGDITVSRDLLDSVNELAFLDRYLELDRATVLDIGSGYGRFAHRLQQHWKNSTVYCCDVIAEARFVCEYYIRFRGLGDSVRMVTPRDLDEALASRSFLLAVNIHSLSECNSCATRWWLQKLAANRIPYLFFVPNPDSHNGKRLLSTENSGARIDLAPICAEYGYRTIVAGPKYADPQVQRFGVSPTWYHLLRLT
jgi:hypothetical protein